MFSTAVFNIAPRHDSYASTTMSCNEGISPVIANNSSTSNSGFDSFAFNYSKSGGLRSTHDAICYSSNDGLVVKINNKSVTTKQLSNSAANDLQQTIMKNIHVFNTYRPTPGSADYFNYTITILLNGSKYRGSWTDASSGVPTGLLEVRKEIERAASNP
ncbi:MAG TPA: hypothetical protein VH796_18700 [Nitrososphaeraceae archaeon]